MPCAASEQEYVARACSCISYGGLMQTGASCNKNNFNEFMPMDMIVAVNRVEFGYDTTNRGVIGHPVEEARW